MTSTVMNSCKPIRRDEPEFATRDSEDPTMDNKVSPMRRPNLTVHRAPTSVWQRRGWDGSRNRMVMTRLLLGVGGGALTMQGLRQRSFAGGVLAAVGGMLTCWAISGQE